MHATPTPDRAGAVPAALLRVFEAVGASARAAGVFGPVEVREGMLWAAAKGAPEEAHYRLEWDAGKLWVSLVTPARYLSQSIEADLMFTGDKVEELIEEELGALGVEGGAPQVEHFRSADKLFTFRSPVRGAGADERSADVACKWLLAYEAAFRDLGDVGSKEEE